MTLLAFFLSFLAPKEFGAYFRAVCLGAKHARFPKDMPNNNTFLSAFVFKWLRYKLTHEHLLDISGTDFAHYNSAQFAFLLIERDEGEILDARRELLQGLNFSDIFFLLRTTCENATNQNASTALEAFHIMMGDIKKRMGTPAIVHTLIFHSKTHGPNLLYWALNKGLINETDLQAQINAPYPEDRPNLNEELTQCLKAPTAHTLFKRAQRIADIQNNPLLALKSPNPRTA